VIERKGAMVEDGQDDEATMIAISVARERGERRRFKRVRERGRHSLVRPDRYAGFSLTSGPRGKTIIS
jgi:hypothetical protein